MKNKMIIIVYVTLCRKVRYKRYLKQFKNTKNYVLLIQEQLPLTSQQHVMRHES